MSNKEIDNSIKQKAKELIPLIKSTQCEDCTTCLFGKKDWCSKPFVVDVLMEYILGEE